MDQKKIGGFLRELRKEQGIAQEQFAEEMGVSARTVSRWETGTNMPEALVYVTVVMFPLYTTGLLSRLRIRNAGRGRIPGPALKALAFVAAFAVAALIRIAFANIFG